MLVWMLVNAFISGRMPLFPLGNRPLQYTMYSPNLVSGKWEQPCALTSYDYDPMYTVYNPPIAVRSPLVDPMDAEDLEIRILLIHSPVHWEIGYIQMSWLLAGCRTSTAHGTTAKWTNQILDDQLADWQHCDLIYNAKNGNHGICLPLVLGVPFWQGQKMLLVSWCICL